MSDSRSERSASGFVQCCLALLNDLDEALEASASAATICEQVAGLESVCAANGLTMAATLCGSAVGSFGVDESGAVDAAARSALVDFLAWFRRYVAQVELGSGDPDLDAGDPKVTLDVPVEWRETVHDFVAEARGHLASSESALLDIDPHRFDRQPIDEALRALHTIKGVASILQLLPLTDLVHSAEDLLDVWRRDGRTVTSREIDTALMTIDVLEQMVESLNGGPACRVSQVQRLMQRIRRVGELRVPAPAGDPESMPDVTSAGLVGQGTQVVAEPVEHDPDCQVEDRSDHVLRIDELVQDLAISHAALGRHPSIAAASDIDVRRILAKTERALSELSRHVKSLRRVPAAGMFRRMVRLVRDLSIKLQKRVDLQLEGRYVELDRDLIELVSGPLMHMLRNAVDHGIESVEDRVAASKSPVGKLRLSLRQLDSAVEIEVQDDGRGLSRDAILERALADGLVSTTAAEQLSDYDIRQLVFAPGLSTAGVVTQLSGRGVGMDIVQRNIARVGGTVEIDSTLGEGSTFRVSIPSARGEQAIEAALTGRPLAESIASALASMAGWSTRVVERPDDIASMSDRNCWCARIRFSRQRGGSGEIWLRASAEFLRGLGARLFGRSADEMDLDSEGAEVLTELANIGCGELVMLLGGDLDLFELGLPEIVEAERFAIEAEDHETTLCHTTRVGLAADPAGDLLIEARFDAVLFALAIC